MIDPQPSSLTRRKIITGAIAAGAGAIAAFVARAARARQPVNINGWSPASILKAGDLVTFYDGQQLYRVTVVFDRENMTGFTCEPVRDREYLRNALP